MWCDRYVSQSSVNYAIYEALTVVQHRGQDAPGMVTCDDLRVHLVRVVAWSGSVSSRHMRSLGGNVGIGHVRYQLQVVILKLKHSRCM
ncbi:MAG: hypothetical protein CM1200mP18_10640 [Gammaproteobacteria bacterium]|nr:MAG: hypothetical protein CM1200mP18_10640 [Gammaproteobacteria bacterium]